MVAALVREQLKEGREGISKVSLRASADAVDVSVIARKEGGGGHRQAAGFSTSRSRRAGRVPAPGDRGAAVATAADGVLLVAKPAGVTSHDVVARCGAASLPASEGRPRRHAGPVRDRAAARAGRPGDALPALHGRSAEGLSGAARFGVTSDTGDPTGELSVTGRPDRRGRGPAGARCRSSARSSSACRLLGGQGGGRAAVQAGAARRGGRAARRTCGSTGWT